METLWPGRTMEILPPGRTSLVGKVERLRSWMDAFKEHQKTAGTELHSEVHGVHMAMHIIRASKSPGCGL